MALGEGRGSQSGSGSGSGRAGGRGRACPSVCSRISAFLLSIGVPVLKNLESRLREMPDAGLGAAQTTLPVLEPALSLDGCPASDREIPCSFGRTPEEPSAEARAVVWLFSPFLPVSPEISQF